ncbi:MAG: CoA transferase, partial [Candidatus Binataceae bacterium]
RIVSEWTATRARDDIVATLIANGVPCAPVREVDEIAADPELDGRGLMHRVDYPNRGEVSVLGSAVKLSGLGDGAAITRPPDLGEHTAEILARVGIGGGDLAQLRRDGVI